VVIFVVVVFFLSSFLWGKTPSACLSCPSLFFLCASHVFRCVSPLLSVRLASLPLPLLFISVSSPPPLFLCPCVNGTETDGRNSAPSKSTCRGPVEKDKLGGGG
jgi:hypothetical protein